MQEQITAGVVRLQSSRGSDDANCVGENQNDRATCVDDRLVQPDHGRHSDASRASRRRDGSVSDRGLHNDTDRDRNRKHAIDVDEHQEAAEITATPTVRVAMTRTTGGKIRAQLTSRATGLATAVASLTRNLQAMIRRWMSCGRRPINQSPYAKVFEVRV